MNCYETKYARIEMAIPARMRNLKANQIIEAVRKVEFNPDKKRPAKPGKGLQMLQATSDAVFDPDNWKNPFVATFPRDADGWDAREWVKAAAMWFHGSQPGDTYTGVYSAGYDCW